MLRICIFILFSFQLSVGFAKKNIPVEYFNHLPMIQQPTLSPDGNTIATIYNQGDETQVAIVPFNKPNDFNVLVKLGGEKYRIEEINWANNERLLVTISQPIKVNSSMNRITHLYSIGINGKTIELKSNAYRKAKTEEKKWFASSQLLSLLEEDENHVLVVSQDTRDGYNRSVFKVNVLTGEYKKYLPNSNHLWGWGVNKKGKVLIGIGGTGNEKNLMYYYVRDTEEDKWTKIKTTTPYVSETFSPLIYDNEKHILYVKTNYKLGKEAIWTFDTVKKDYIEVIGQAPGTIDVSGGIYSLGKGNRKLIGFRYLDETEHREYFDDASNKLGRDINKLFEKNGLGATIYDHDSDLKHIVIAAYHNSKPTKYILFDSTKTKFTPWYSTYPKLSKYHFPTVENIEFTARDGMKLYGYYTAPEGVKNPPLVLFPHGGPYARDYPGFDPFVKLFTSRGYAVLQINYRGSTGFGKAYEEAGYFQWGKKMQTDLIDGLKWVGEHKGANIKKACIVGASYGGYAALVAGYQTPNLFKCIASISGISDMKQQIKHWRIRGSEDYIENAIHVSAHNTKDISPIQHVEEYKIPVLLIHGESDTRVDFLQSKKMHEALKKAGKKSKFVSFKYGTHFLDDAANRKVAMEELDKFLKKYLK